MLIEALDQDLETIISQAYQDVDSKDPVAIISRMILNGECQSRQYSLSDYFLTMDVSIIMASFTYPIKSHYASG